MAGKRDDRPAKGPGSKLGANTLLSAVPDSFQGAAEPAEPRDPRDPPPDSERRASAAPVSAPRPGPKPTPEREATGESMVELMARAQVAWLGAGIRYWGEMAELFGRRGANIADMARLTDRDMDERDKLRLLDEARGYLREVGEISMREAQALTDDMAKLEAALRNTQARPRAKRAKRHGRPSE